MSKPTLLKKGALMPPDGNLDLKLALDEWVPIDYIIDWFQQRLNRVGMANRVLILKSETASGKSTLFPPTLLRQMIRGDNVPGIICTQPKVLTARENVMEILKYNDDNALRLGENIGWSTKNDKIKLTRAGLLSATVGTLAQQLKVMTDDEIMAKYKYILIDETHERDLQTDMTIYRLKNLLIRNQENASCPFVVLMSATFDPTSFLNYFAIPRASNFIWCTGATAFIDEKWDWNGGRTVNNYPQAAAEVVDIIVKENPDDDPESADVLIFMPGAAEFKLTVGWLDKINARLAKEGKTVFSLLQIDGPAVNSRNDDFLKTIVIPVGEHVVTIGTTAYTPGRRVIITTNVAETGLTLNNLRYVVDAGYNRETEFNPLLGINALITKPAPQSRIRQRRGRAGRKLPGVFYPLYPKHIHAILPELQFPAILNDDTSSIVLDLMVEQIKVKFMKHDVAEFVIGDLDMIDTPSPDALHAGLEKLYTIGFISMIAPPWNPEMSVVMSDEPVQNKTGLGITKLGVIASAFTDHSPENVRMILGAYFWDCSVLDTITIAAWLMSDERSFTNVPIKGGGATGGKPMTPRPGINWGAIYKDGLPGFISSSAMLFKIRLLIGDEFINGIIMFNAIKYIISASEPKSAISGLMSWCDKNYVSYRACLTFMRDRDDIIEQMIRAGLDVFSQEDESLHNSTELTFMDTVTKLKYCIYDGYRNNLLTRADNKYYTINGLEVMPPKLFREDEEALAVKAQYGFALKAMPTSIVYRGLTLKMNKKTNIYDVVVDRVCVLDGFLSSEGTGHDFAN